MRYTILLSAVLLSGATIQTSYTDEASNWRANYEAKLKAPQGWLAVAGLFWLHEGPNVVAVTPHVNITLNLRNGRVTRGQTELKSDATEHPDTVKIGDVALRIIERDKKIGVRVWDASAETRREFTGCTWFPADESWRIKAKWVAYSEPKKVPITNILGMTDEETSPGYAEFTIKGQRIKLEPVIEDDQLFFMFKDATTGRTTYPAGRFLYAPIPKGNEVVLDFNQSHNPPCAFTAFATCPLPPKQNTMPITLEAGEKNYGKH